MPTNTKTSKESAPKKPKAPKKLTVQELKRFLQTVSSVQTKAIQDEISSRKKADTDRAVDRATISLEFYNKLKVELEDACIEKLHEKLGGPGHGLCFQYKKPGGDAGKWSKSKILKIIAGMPARQPDTDSGILKAVRTIELGKPRKWSKEVKEKRKLAAEAKTKKVAKQKSREAMFEEGYLSPSRRLKKKSDRKVKAEKKKAKAKKVTAKKTPKPKSAGAMAVGDGLTKHQRYELKRVHTAESKENKNENRRKRRAEGKAN